MRLLKEMPDPVSEALQKGRVSLSTAAAVQVFLQREKREQGKTYTPAQKQELFQRIEGKSQRETEKLLAELSPQSVAADRERVVSAKQTEIRFVADEALMAKLNRVRELGSHRNPNPGYVELLEWMADLAIAELERRKSPSLRQGSTAGKKRNSPQAAKPATPAPEWIRDLMGGSPTRVVPGEVRRQVWSRDQGRCTYRDQQTGRVCGSSFLLEMDHVRPFALGGLALVGNLRLRCRAHNQLWAKQVFRAGRERVPERG